MDTILDSETSVPGSESLKSFGMKAASAPLEPAARGTQLKPQISAPSYFHSLERNELPPYVKPEREARPRLLIGTIVNEEEAINMIAAADAEPDDGLKVFLGKLLVKKKVVANDRLIEKRYLLGLLKETVKYAAQRDFDAIKLACLLTIYLNTHVYFKSYYWTAPVAVWCYFKEIMIRHTIEDSPDGQQVFEPEECYDIVTHFHTMYLSNLPLIHILTFGAYRLKYVWPFKLK